jgi:hypothetical protein
VKPGDIVRWKSDGGLGIIIKVIPFIGQEKVLDIYWQTGPQTGRMNSRHSQLEYLSESR